MLQKSYEGIIDLLSVKVNQIHHIELVKDITLTNYTNIDNRIIKVHQGKFSLKRNKKQINLEAGDLIFIPENLKASLTYGGENSLFLDNEELIKTQSKYVKTITNPEKKLEGNVFSCITFNTKVHQSIDFFKFMDISAFKIEDNALINNLIRFIIYEDIHTELGKASIIQSYVLQLTIMLIRYIISERLFIEQIVLKSGLLTDPLLIKLYQYIVLHLSENLSNECLAQKLGVSKDYIGAYFKKFTGFQLQECIEVMRLTKAVELLKTTSMKIHDVSQVCGYKDTSYFCKKFKTLWGITAGKIKKQQVAH
ncbi:MAG: helix-turn-helix transcriptional regulator [Bacteroidota bacterium]